MNKFNYSIIAVSVLFFVNLCFPSQKSKQMNTVFGTVVKFQKENSLFEGTLFLSDEAIEEYEKQAEKRIVVDKNNSWVSALENLTIDEIQLDKYLRDNKLYVHGDDRKRVKNIHEKLREKVKSERQEKQQARQKKEQARQMQVIAYISSNGLAFGRDNNIHDIFIFDILRLQKEEEVKKWQAVIDRRSNGLVSIENVDWNNNTPCLSSKLTSVGKAIAISDSNVVGKDIFI